MKNNYQAPKYPRVQVTVKTHERLAREAKKEGTSIHAVVEAKIKLANRVLKGLKNSEHVAG